jgi:protoporphyrinogen oxidase
MDDHRRVAVIVGGGPAGLTAALELLRRTDVRPIVVEDLVRLGGISRTEECHGNRIDIGGHRFFSKSDEVMRFWLDIMPLERGYETSFDIGFQGQRTTIPPTPPGEDAAIAAEVMLVRERKSRVYWRGRLLDYPLTASLDTIAKIGLATMLRAGVSYLRAAAFPIREERTLEDFLINRFGRRLYRMFFQSYTEKVWGVPCRRIDAAWGAQRIRGLDVKGALAAALRTRGREDLRQRDTETTLIRRYIYPKLGPGQMWEAVGRRVEQNGGEILRRHEAVSFRVQEGRIVGVAVRNLETGENREIAADYVFSSTSIQQLVSGLCGAIDVPADVRRISNGLAYRDFFTVGLLVDRLRLEGGSIPDNWLYVQEPSVRLGRVQVFNNWSPYLVADRSRVWLGLEYFCFATDDLWSWDDEALIALGRRELVQLGLIADEDFRAGCVVRQRRAYPAYFGTYRELPRVRAYLDGIANLFCIGRNGQHRYNNQDHSMLTAMRAVDLVRAGSDSRDELWQVNAEPEYHEENA